MSRMGGSLVRTSPASGSLITGPPDTRGAATCAELETKAIQGFVITEKAIVGAFSVITNLRMDHFQALM